jgi:predicted nucleic acid-binding protein
MKIYFDTSAIAKYFHNEGGSVQVIEMIDDNSNTLWISELARIEFSSAFHRKFRMGEISAETLQDVITAFESKMNVWHIEPFSALQTEEANRIITEYGKTIGIRTLDALHLAAFHLLRQEDWVFAVADKQLNNVATIAGVNTMFIQ